MVFKNWDYQPFRGIYMRIQIQPTFNLEQFPGTEMNDIDAHKIGLPEGGVIRILGRSKKNRYFFTVIMKINPEVPEGTIATPILFESIPFLLNKGMNVENAAKLLNPSEGYRKYLLNESSLKSQSQRLKEALHEKAPLPNPEEADLFKTVIIKQNPMDQQNFIDLDNLDRGPKPIIEGGNAENLREIEINLHEIASEYETIVENTTDDALGGKDSISLPPSESVDAVNHESEVQTPQDMDEISEKDNEMTTLDQFDYSEYHDCIDIYELLEIKSDSHIAQFQLSERNLKGFVVISPNFAQKLQVFPGAFVAWEDPVTRGNGMSAVLIEDVCDDTLVMDLETAFETNIAKIPNHRLVLYSMEPPIIKVKEITLRPIPKEEIQGRIILNFRNANALGFTDGDIVAISKRDSSFTVYAKLLLSYQIPENAFHIDPNLINNQLGQEDILVLQKRKKQVVNLEIIRVFAQIPESYEGNHAKLASTIKSRLDVIRIHFMKYYIYSGICIRHPDFEAEFLFKSCKPALGPQEIGLLTPASQIEIEFEKLELFDTIFLLDISRSMQAQDVWIDKEYFEFKKMTAFLKQLNIPSPFLNFKPEIYARRHTVATFFILLYILEKLARKIGERTSLLTFADKTHLISTIANDLWIDSTIPSSGILQSYVLSLMHNAIEISGQTTNVKDSLIQCNELIDYIRTEDPTRPISIIFITDGSPEDFANFHEYLHPSFTLGDIRMKILDLGGVSLQSVIPEEYNSYIQFHMLESFEDFIPLYKKLARSFNYYIE